MREGTSGFGLNEKQDGSISIEYVDYGVSQFGGCEFEKTYTLDSDNTTKLKLALQSTYKGSLRKMIEEAFGRGFDDGNFLTFCKENNIQYSSSSWTSGGFDYDDLYERRKEEMAAMERILARQNEAENADKVVQGNPGTNS